MSFPGTGATIDEIDDIEDTTEDVEDDTPNSDVESDDTLKVR